jgi:osmoprotectant transport system permease protein
MKRCLLLLLVLTAWAWADLPEQICIGSKAFPESWVLGEACSQLARESGAEVKYRKSLGATEIIYQALKQGSIDVYPEYSGTIHQVFLKGLDHPSQADALKALALDRLGMSYSLGFSNSYALAVPRQLSGVTTISDLNRFPQLRYAVNQEFVGRKDGWVGLAQAYSLHPKSFTEMQHELSYAAVAGGKADVTNVYSTDAQVDQLGLRLLIDDKQYFPRYDAVLLYRADLPNRCPKAWAALLQLVGKISEEKMRRANARLVLQKQDAAEAGSFLLDECLPQRSARSQVAPSSPGWNWAMVAQRSLRHLQLVSLSLCMAIAVGIPLGVLASRSPRMARLTLSLAGLLQTIPSLALLAFVVPVTGVGPAPALLALFVYSLLPIVRNTYTGLTTLPGNLSEAAEALGLPPLAQLVRIRLPMASPSILAGIKTSAVINVGTATLAALVGAGGLGESILQGISLLDHQLIFQGAVPAAALALLAQAFFDGVEKVVVPRGLRI